MKVLVACEFSGIVREAFRRRGHDAWSCDLDPAEDDNRYHYQCDVWETVDAEKWEMLIAFPPCTHLCSSGAQYWNDKQARQRAALNFVRMLSEAEVPRTAIENPVGILSRLWRKPDQIIQPFQFGDPYMKKTCLWLKGLPALTPTNTVAPVAHWHGGVRRGGIKKDGTRTPSKLPTALKYGERERSRTFQGIADAMAEQWGKDTPRPSNIDGERGFALSPESIFGARGGGRGAEMSEKIAMSFSMIVDEPIGAGHQKYRTEGWLNAGLEEHLKTCFECRATLAKDLRDFAEQIYTIAMRPGVPHSGKGWVGER